MEKALLITVNWGKRLAWSAEDEVGELRELVRSAGVAVAGEMVCRRAEASPALLIGKGKVAEIGAAAKAQGASVVIFNEDLSPAQQRNIEEIVDRKTIDRTQLILDIFAQRAHSQEGQLQVELAQMRYLLPRLIGEGVMLSRLGGGIGTRGPGEQKLEVDRRRIRERIMRLRNELKQLERRRLAVRKERATIAVPVVALVGYTNAGKTTLLNALTGAEAVAANQLFTTLDPLARRLVLPNHQTVVLTDTVGFLHHLPHDLIEAFHATLEEASEASLLLHVLDVSHPLALEHAEAVYQVLRTLHLEDRPVLTVLNKVDLLEDRACLPRFLREFAPAVVLSAKTREGIDALVEALMAQFDRLMTPQKLFLKPAHMSWLSRIYKEGEVTVRRDTPRGIYLEARLPAALLRSLDGSIKKS